MRLLFIVGVLIYLSVLQLLGFILSMLPLMVIFCLLYGSKLNQAIFVSLVFTLSSYVLFEILLEISLGRGDIFR